MENNKNILCNSCIFYNNDKCFLYDHLCIEIGFFQSTILGLFKPMITTVTMACDEYLTIHMLIKALNREHYFSSYYEKFDITSEDLYNFIDKKYEAP